MERFLSVIVTFFKKINIFFKHFLKLLFNLIRLYILLLPIFNNIMILIWGWWSNLWFIFQRVRAILLIGSCISLLGYHFSKDKCTKEVIVFYCYIRGEFILRRIMTSLYLERGLMDSSFWWARPVVLIAPKGFSSILRGSDIICVCWYNLMRGVLRTISSLHWYYWWEVRVWLKEFFYQGWQLTISLVVIVLWDGRFLYFCCFHLWI